MFPNVNLICTCVLLFLAKASADPAYATLKIELINASIYSPNYDVFQLLQLYFNLASDDQNIAAATYEELMDAKYKKWYINQNLTIKNAISESHGGLSTDGILFNSLVDISNTPEIQLGIDVRLSHFPRDLNDNDLSLDFERSVTQKVTYTVCNGTWPAAPPQENTIQWESYSNIHGAVYDTLTYNVSINCSSDCYANYTRSLLTTAAAVEIALMKVQIHTPNEAHILLQIYFHLMVNNDTIASATYEAVISPSENGGIQQDLDQTNAIAEIHGGLSKDGVLFNAFVDISNTPEIQLVIDIRVSNFVTGTWDYKGVDVSLNFERTINHSVPYAVRDGTWPPQTETITWDSINNDSRGQLDNFTYSFSITCLSECYEHYIHPPTTTVTTVETTTITSSTMTTTTATATVRTASATTSAATTGFHTEATTTAIEATVVVTGSEEPLRPSSSRDNTGFLVALVVLVIFILAHAVLLVFVFVKGHKFWPLFNRKNPKLNVEDVNVENMHSTVMIPDQQSPTNDNSTTFAAAMYHHIANVSTLPTAGCTQTSNEYDDYVKPDVSSEEYAELQE